MTACTGAIRRPPGVWSPQNGVLPLLGGLVFGFVPAAPGGASSEPHPLHLSTGQMVLEGPTVVLTVRLFQDDLENALMRFHGIEGLRLRADPIVDSLFADYFNTTFTLWIGSDAVPGRVVESGEGEEIWWYTLVFGASAPVTAVAFRNGLLFDLFDDQRNITRVLHLPSERQRTFYSVPPDREPHRFPAD